MTTPLDKPIKVSVVAYDPQGLQGATFSQGNYTPLVGVDIKLCSNVDVDCARAAQEQVSDVGGKVSFGLPAKANVFLFFTRSDLIPTRAYIHPSQIATRLDPATGDLSFPAPLIANSTFKALAAAASVVPETSALYGHIFVRTFDCFGQFAGGTSFTVDRTTPKTVPFVIIDGLPSTTATVTDGRALAGALNVPVGPVTVTARIGAGGQTIGTFNGYVVPQTIVVMEVAPSVYYATR